MFLFQRVPKIAFIASGLINASFAWLGTVRMIGLLSFEHLIDFDIAIIKERKEKERDKVGEREKKKAREIEGEN